MHFDCDYASAEKFIKVYGLESILGPEMAHCDTFRESLMPRNRNARKTKAVSLTTASEVPDFAEAGLPALTAEPWRPPKPRSRFYPAMLIACLTVFSLIAGFMLTIQTDSQANTMPVQEDAIGAVLAAGGLYYADADQLDHRALVSSRISHLTETPDIVVIADRSWQLVQQDLRWEKQVFGAYVDRLSPSDVKRFLQELTSANHMPKKVILGIAPDYVIQSDEAASLPVSEPEAHLTNAASALGADFADIFRGFDSGFSPRPGLAPKDRKLDTFYPDGSVVWSGDRTRDVESQRSNRTADRLAEALRQKVQASPFSQIVATGEVIAETKSHGVEVIIALTPLHPAIYGQIYNKQTAFQLHEGIEDLLAMARALDVVTIGSFEPFAAGCKDGDFAALSVPGSTCLSKLVDAGIIIGESEQSSPMSFGQLR